MIIAYFSYTYIHYPPIFKMIKPILYSILFPHNSNENQITIVHYNFFIPQRNYFNFVKATFGKNHNKNIQLEPFKK